MNAATRSPSISGGFCCQLLFDVTHLGHARHATHAGGLHTVFGEQHDRHQNHDGGDGGQEGGAQQQIGGGQLGAQGRFSVVNSRYSSGVHETKKPMSCMPTRMEPALIMATLSV